MKEMFSTIYEVWFGLYNQAYDLIFSTLYENGGYVKIGITFILVPLICWLLFYYLWKYPYGKLWHWIVWLIVTVIIVSGFSFWISESEIFSSGNQALNDAIGDSATGYEEFGKSLPGKFALYNGILSLVFGFLISLVMKQFSKVQIHLPF